MASKDKYGRSPRLLARLKAERHLPFTIEAEPIGNLTPRVITATVERVTIPRRTIEVQVKSVKRLKPAYRT